MRTRKKRNRILTAAILVVAIPVYLAALAFCILGVHVRNNGLIYPNVSIAGIDVSQLTYEEAVLVLDAQKLREYEERWNATEVTITFPDSSEVSVTGKEVLLSNDAQAAAVKAYYVGRVDGFFPDTVAYIRHVRGKNASLDFSYYQDPALLRSRAAEFTQVYNDKLGSSVPVISAEKIVMVKGAGQVRADETEIFNLIYEGLNSSFVEGQHIDIVYNLPQSSADMAELVSMWQSILVRPLSAEYDPDTKTVSQSEIGVGFDLVRATTLLGGTESGKTVAFDIVYTQPEVTRDYLESLLFRDLIGECTTQIAGSANRLNNIVLASAEVDGIILEPGEEFSFNRTVGVRSWSKGYREAPGISGGQMVPMIGGGICQVSSTIHSAIMDTDILITERHPHGRPITYLPRGRDATVFWGHLDFRFVNNTEFPLRIDIEIDERTLTIQVYGTIT